MGRVAPPDVTPYLNRMFDELRDTLRTFTSRLDPDERRRMSIGMREALVHAKLAINDMRAAVAATEARLAAERTELETVRRRQGYAADIGDNETVAIAERFAAQHAERVAMLESKHMVQQQELTLAEREYDTMSGELRRVMSGIAPQASTPESAAAREVNALFDEPAGAAHGAAHGTARDADSLGEALDDPLRDTPPPSRRTRAEREADAEARLADLKRQLGR